MTVHRNQSSVRTLTCQAAGLIVSALLALIPSAARSQDPSEQFERLVRPVLVNRCQACHGEEKQEGGLRLDSREALLRGGDQGRAALSGAPEQSLLIQAIGYGGDLQMPPDAKLPDATIAAFVEWVQNGLPWPDKPAASAATSASVPRPGEEAASEAAASTHWAFRPVARPELPAVRQSDWVSEQVDQFILARLEAAGLAPSPEADRRTLLRRATFDLIGLPPTPAELAAFEQDTSSEAWPRVIDRLLASPQYGERWARHWLDVARFADTRGYVFTADPRYAYAYTFRDYVIEALNSDLPFDEFIRQQLAADLMPHDQNPRSLAALGFLTLGRRFDNNIHDIIDDRIDVVTRGLMGLTVTCARCHDHKYDPTTQADYYSLYGVFASCNEPDELPAIGMPAENSAYEEHQRKLADAVRAINELIDAELPKQVDDLRHRAGDYLVKVVETQGQEPPDKDLYISLDPGDLRPPALARWKEWIDRHATAGDPVFSTWRRFADAQPADYPAIAQSLLAAANGENVGSSPPPNRLVREAFAKRVPTSMSEVARVYGDALAAADQLWRSQVQSAADATAAGNATEPPKALADADAEALRQVLYAEESPTAIPRDKLEGYLDRANYNELVKRRQQQGALEATSPAAPPRAHVLRDSPTPHEPHIFIRGNAGRPGAQVPRQFVHYVAGSTGRPFVMGSGRLELAQAITSRQNPLTARVLVNRIWLEHFGRGLVGTPSDFGLRSDPPTHPELLDYLADELMADGWSLKRLHRRIMLSRTYKQSSAPRADTIEADPENNLLARMNRRRLDFEAFRDSLLFVAGQLETVVGGRSVDLMEQPFTHRRTLYGYVDRQNVASLFRIFDFANPDSSSPSRPQTTVPQQALFAMNSPFVLELAAKLAARQEVSSATTDAARVSSMYQLLFDREPMATESAVAAVFLREARLQNRDAALAVALSGRKSADLHDVWRQYAQALLLTNEFCFVD